VGHSLVLNPQTYCQDASYFQQLVLLLSLLSFHSPSSFATVQQKMEISPWMDTF
jgi:hypothetical protein